MVNLVRFFSVPIVILQVLTKLIVFPMPTIPFVHYCQFCRFSVSSRKLWTIDLQTRHTFFFDRALRSKRGPRNDYFQGTFRKFCNLATRWRCGNFALITQWFRHYLDRPRPFWTSLNLNWDYLVMSLRGNRFSYMDTW